jgi:hypothetical protein
MRYAGAILLLSLLIPAACVSADELTNLALPLNGAFFLAEPTAQGNGSLLYINDDDTGTYWFAGDGQPRSTVLVSLRAPSEVHSVRFRSWSTGRHAPRDYQLIATNSITGVTHQLADVTGDTTLGPNWVQVDFAPVVADRIVLRVLDTQEHQHGAVIYELQVMGVPPTGGIDPGGTLDPTKTWLVFAPGKSLNCAYGAASISMKIFGGLPGQERVIFERQTNEPALSQIAVDISEWEGRTINLKFQVDGGSASDIGAWVAPRIVKNGQTLLDFVRDWSQYWECTIVGDVALGDAYGEHALLSHVNSSVIFSVPVSSQGLSLREQQRVDRQRANYGASEERLQPRDADAQIDLAGVWQMADEDQTLTHPFGSGEQRILPNMSSWIWRSVKVPGSVRSGLIEARVIGDPYWANNAADSRWVEAKQWWFKKTVDIPASWSGKRVHIGFDGIDYYSSVWFNGTFLGDHEGMYGGPVRDVTSLVRYGQPNEIVVLIHRGGTDEPGQIFKGFIFQKWHYQTDISPRGIWADARIVSTGDVRLEHPFVKTISIGSGSADLEITVDAINSGAPTVTTIQGSISGWNFTGGNHQFAIPANLPTGLTRLAYRLSIADPQLWWPHGMGDPNLYTLRLSTNGDNIQTRFGIRTIELLPNPGVNPQCRLWQYANPSRKNLPPLYPFIVKINGRVISMRGAGGYSAHDQLYRFHKDKDKWFIKVAQGLNYNFIRLHGAGMIGPDDFYDACDEMGMMVWQEFMIANLELHHTRPEVWRTQVVKSIERLRNHPSLVYWCGGNEFDADSARNKAVVDTIEDAVSEYDGTRPFTRASPWGGDLHYANENTYDLGGFPACTEYSGAFDGSIVHSRALNKFLPAEDVERWPPTTTENLSPYLPADLLSNWDNSRRGPFAFHTALTDRLPGWVGDMELVIANWLYFGVPRSMQDAIEISQLHNGFMTSYIMDAFRAHWPLPSLYASWDYAPIWPMSITWGPVDYYGGVQPCAYYYKRAQAPLHVLMQYGSNSVPRAYAPGQQFQGKIYVVTDLATALSNHKVDVGIWNDEGQKIVQSQYLVASIPSGPASVWVTDYNWTIPAMRAQPVLVVLTLKDNVGRQVSRSVYPLWITPEASAMMADHTIRRDRGPWLTQLKTAQTQLALTPVSTQATFEGEEAEVVLRIGNTGSRLAFNTGIEISNSDCRYICDDNYFCLLPGESRTVTVRINKQLHPFYERVQPALVRPVGADLQFVAKAWNAPSVTVSVPTSNLVTAWEFNNDGDLEGWWPAHSLTHPVVSNGIMHMSVTGGDPYACGPSWVTVDADTQRYISVRMAVDSGTLAELYWGTESQPFHVEGRRVAFAIIPDGQFHTYLIDMSTHPQWTGVVNTLRLDPTIGNTGHIKIDYIRVLSSAPPVLDVAAPSSQFRFALVGEMINVSTRISNTGFSPATNIRAVLSVDGQTIISDPAQVVSSLDPGGQISLAWQVRADVDRVSGMCVTVTADGLTDSLKRYSHLVVAQQYSALPGGAPAQAQAWIDNAGTAVIENSRLRLVVGKSNQGYTIGSLYARDGAAWQLVATSCPLARVGYLRDNGDRTVMVLEPQSASVSKYEDEARLSFGINCIDADGCSWQGNIVFSLKDRGDTICATYSVSCGSLRRITDLVGPSLCAGDRSFGSAKTQALFPGLEWLEGNESSSNTLECAPEVSNRAVPHPHKITVPFMAISKEEIVVALLWDPLWKWDGTNACVSAKFSSPNWLEGQNNHLMELFVPSIPRWVQENQLFASEPYSLSPGTALSIKCHYYAGKTPSVLDMVEKWYSLFGVPAMPGDAALLDSGLLTARRGLMETLWDPSAQCWSHVVGYQPWPSPGLTQDLFVDSLTESDPAAREALLNMVDASTQRAISLWGESSLSSPVGTHLPGYLLPYYIGHLDSMVAQMQAEANSLIESRQSDGGWYVPVNLEHPELTIPGTKELGSCAPNAYFLLRHARVTGNSNSLRIGIEALAYMDRFAIPRAAQVWEIPQHAPDILAAAWAVGAYMEGYLLSGDKRYLEKARYWGKAGLHFVYAWRAPDRQVMDYSTIPVYGCTFFTHPWFGLPVQWCGMVYAYHVLQLAEYDSSLPWRSIAEGITRSCVQQMNISPYLGTYGDSLNLLYSNTPNGVYINPDNIYKCTFRLKNGWGNISARKLGGSSRIAHVSTAGRVPVGCFDSTGRILTFRLEYPLSRTCQVLVFKAGAPISVFKGSQRLTKVFDVDSVSEGWSYNSAHSCVIIKTVQSAPAVNISLVFSGAHAPVNIVDSPAQAKHLSDGALVDVTGVLTVDSGSFRSTDSKVCVYVQSTDRTSGIRVTLASPPLSPLKVGDRVEVLGTLATVAGERCIQNADVHVLR